MLYDQDILHIEEEILASWRELPEENRARFLLVPIREILTTAQSSPFLSTLFYIYLRRSVTRNLLIALGFSETQLKQLTEKDLQNIATQLKEELTSEVIPKLIKQHVQRLLVKE